MRQVVLVGAHWSAHAAPAGHTISHGFAAEHSSVHEAPALHVAKQPSFVEPHVSRALVQPTQARLHGPFRLHVTLHVAPFSQRAWHWRLLSPCRHVCTPQRQQPLHDVLQTPFTVSHASLISAAVQAPPWMGVHAAAPASASCCSPGSTTGGGGSVPASAGGASPKRASKSRPHAVTTRHATMA